MTKRELLDKLAPFADDQAVFIDLVSNDYPDGSQVIIQGVRAVPPWHPGPGVPNLIGLVAHARNAEVKP